MQNQNARNMENISNTENHSNTENQSDTDNSSNTNNSNMTNSFRYTFIKKYITYIVTLFPEIIVFYNILVAESKSIYYNLPFQV